MSIGLRSEVVRKASPFVITKISDFRTTTRETRNRLGRPWPSPPTPSGWTERGRPVAVTRAVRGRRPRGASGGTASSEGDLGRACLSQRATAPWSSLAALSEAGGVSANAVSRGSSELVSDGAESRGYPPESFERAALFGERARETLSLPSRDVVPLGHENLRFSDDDRDRTGAFGTFSASTPPRPHLSPSSDRAGTFEDSPITTSPVVLRPERPSRDRSTKTFTP
jgi:hypothetical protein